jgi:hypothetical protein
MLHFDCYLYLLSAVDHFRVLDRVIGSSLVLINAFDVTFTTLTIIECRQMYKQLSLIVFMWVYI